MKKKILFINGHLDSGGCERSLIDVLKKLDYKKISSVSSRVLADDMKLSTMVQILEVLGYRLVVEPDNGELTRAGAYQIREVKDGGSE